MRGWIVFVALALGAGCLGTEEAPEAAKTAAVEEPPADAAAEDVGNATAATPPPAPVIVEGELFLPPTQGQERTETLIELPVAAPGQALAATVKLGSRYAGAEVPPVLADVQVELRDPAGVVLGSATLDRAMTEATIEGISPTAGTAILALLSYGGSDGSANGDYVRYKAEIR